MSDHGPELGLPRRRGIGGMHPVRLACAPALGAQCPPKACAAAGAQGPEPPEDETGAGTARELTPQSGDGDRPCGSKREPVRSGDPARIDRRARGGGFSFDSREWSGAFGDVGTDWPLLAGAIAASGLDAARALAVFGLCHLISGWLYRLPMPVQPLKLVAALAIAHGFPASVLAGAGISVAALMFVLAATGALDRLREIVPAPVVRGIQLGLGLRLAWLAASRYIAGSGEGGWILAAASAAFLAVTAKWRRVPPGLALLALGGATSAFIDLRAVSVLSGSVPAQPPFPPSAADLWAGFILLAIPQIPLSLGNAVIATKSLADDWFPERGVKVRSLGYSYAALNLAAAVLGGVPVCHGAGGMAGHVAFGARTGGSVLIYGGFFLLAALLARLGTDVLSVVPLAVLGVMLLREGAVLAGRIASLGEDRWAWAVALGVGIASAAVPNGFLWAALGGTAAAHALRRVSGRARARAVFRLRRPGTSG